MLPLLFLCLACPGPTEPDRSDAGEVPLADTGAPEDAGPPELPCNDGKGSLPANLETQSWSTGENWRDVYDIDWSYQGQRTVELPQWEAAQFELDRKARIHGYSVRFRRIARRHLNEDPLTVSLLPDFGFDGANFGSHEPLASVSRCVKDADEARVGDEWLTYTLPNPVDVDGPGLVWVGYFKADGQSPVLALANSPDPDRECNGPYRGCHSSWGFPTLEDWWFNGLSIPIQLDYAVQLHFEYVEAEKRPEDMVFRRQEDGPSFGNRAAVADYDGDGWADVFSGGRLWRNVEGRFEDVTEGSGLSGGAGVWADSDNDGCLDLLTYGGEEKLFLGNCAGQFTDITAEAELDDRQNVVDCNEDPDDMEHAPTQAAAWFDIDNDAKLDFYLSHGECWKGDRGVFYADQFYSHRDGNRYRDLMGRNGWAAYRDYSRGANPIDVDHDGDIDLLVNNYRLQPNRLWLNDGRGRVQEMAGSTGMAGTLVNGAYGHTIGAVWGDLNNDGHWDSIHANLAHPRFYHFSDLSFSLLGTEAGVWEAVDEPGFRFQETHSVPHLGDFDSDGHLDLVISATYAGRPTDFYWGHGDGSFVGAHGDSGLDISGGWGMASADFDHDGDLDLVYNGLWLNQQGQGNSVQFSVLGDGESVNLYALGTTVRIHAGDEQFMRYVDGGSGQGGQSLGPLHVGIGAHSQVDGVSVHYPGGGEVSYAGPFAPGSHHWLLPDGRSVEAWAKPR